MKFRIRMIEMGRVIKTGSTEGEDYISVFNAAHTELLDPCIQCERGDPVVWIEITPA